MKTPGDLLRGDADALAFRTLEPAPAAPRRLLVLLHGVGGQELQLASLGAAVDDDTLVVLPRAPHAISENGYGWFRVAFTAQGPQIVPEEAEGSRRALIAFIGQLQRRHGIAPSRSVVAGFSQGGILSASVALSAPRVVAGFGLLCGRILPELEPAIAPREELAALDGLVVHGRADNKLPVAWAERAHDWLQGLGVPHQLKLYDAGHEFPPAMRADVLAWFGDPARRWNRAGEDAELLLLRNRFAGRFPDALQLEAAIADVEDALMALPPRAASATPLRVADPVLHALALASGFAPGEHITLGVDDVERLFARLVAASHGRPASQHALPDDPAFAERLLVLRETLHHRYYPAVVVSVGG